jgi:hypothetical protein
LLKFSYSSKTLSGPPETLNANVRYELDLRERTIRVEEELKHQRELMLEGFTQMDKRFEQMQVETTKRFDQLTTRIDHFMVWSFATTLTVGGIVIVAIKFL